MIYNVAQVACICETLYRARDLNGLMNFFRYLGTECDQRYYFSTGDQSILRARLLVLLNAGAYNDVYEILRTCPFDGTYHEELQNLWWRAHYSELETHRAKPLGPVEKYRLRKKYPPPMNIWDGEEFVYSFREKSRKMLKTFYKQNKYPCAEEKKLITQKTGLTFIQVSNWYKNRRQREKVSFGGEASPAPSANLPVHDGAAAVNCRAQWNCASDDESPSDVEDRREHRRRKRRRLDADAATTRCGAAGSPSEGASPTVRFSADF